jgi:hypothetical protein
MFNMENSYCQTVHLRVILTQNMIKGILSMTNIKKLLGKKIKFYREKADLTQEQLAEKISINSRSLSLIERGNNFITAETLSSIAEALNVTPKKLFDFDDEFVDPKITKEKLFDLINKNEDKIQTIYNIVKGYLN